jgi:hypothetical protein
MRLLAILLLCLQAFGQATYKGGKYSGAGNYVTQGQGVTGPGENVYCPAGAGELTEGTPTWGASDDMAQLPTQCINTAMSSTPGGTHIGGGAATTYTPADTAALNNALGTLQCGDTIVLTAGNTYTGAFTMPALSCDGGHWITVKSSGVSNPNFPGEGIRATPCIAGISNDAIHGRSLPGYPDYACASFPTVLSAQIVTNAQANGNAIRFAAGANHYRFIGIEFAKDLTHSADALVEMAADGNTMGGNHVIFDRVIIHGVQWTPAATTNDENTAGISGGNSQWVALINSWNYDTYCNASCIDSKAFGSGAGLFQDGPFKLYNNLLASSGETMISGGGGRGPGTPNTHHVEWRSNHSFKPLTWMSPIHDPTKLQDGCKALRDVITKNLGELKNMTYALIEGNVFENSWQGCQSDQTGFGFLFNPANQNNHVSMVVSFDSSAVVRNNGPPWSSTVTYAQNDLVNFNGSAYASKQANNLNHQPDISGTWWDYQNFTHNTASSPTAGNPVDAANCPPNGCILEDIGNNVDYRFCNGVNGCDQSGIPNLQCGTTTPQGSVAGTSCTTGAQCPGSYCAPTTSARLTKAAPAATSVSANACVPGDSPNAKNQNITFRFSEIYNVTHGFEISTGLSSICKDQAAGMSNISIHDNLLHGLSREMSNGKDPFANSSGFALSNNALPPSVIQFVGIRHNTIAVETGNQAGGSGFGTQTDRTDIQYLEGLAITDNVSPASWGVSRGSGSNVTNGIGGQPGLANTYAVDACQRYFTVEAPDGSVPADGVQNFTFAGLPGGGTNYLVSFNGQYTAITNQLATGFTVTAATHKDDTLVVRDSNDCNYTFASNLLGAGTSGIVGIPPHFFGSGQNQSPYPNQNSCGAGNTLSCILDESAIPGSFMNNFMSWGTGRTGDYSIKPSSQYFNAASDALDRPATGKSPGADFVLLAAKTAGVRGTTFLPALTVTTSTLPSGTHGVAYNARLQASVGASQFWDGYKSWFLETEASLCAGNCGSLNNGAIHSGIVIGRDGLVNGPFAILNISRTGCPAACLSNYTVSPTIVGGTWEIGQTVSMADFVNDTGLSANDASFQGICEISAKIGNQFSCPLTNGVNVNIASHAPQGATTGSGCGITGNAECDSVVSFAPISAGTYTFWVGARDGAFQVARGAVTLVVGP